MLASMVEFVTRADGLKPLEQAYGFQFAYGNVVGIDPGRGGRKVAVTAGTTNADAMRALFAQLKMSAELVEGHDHADSSKWSRTAGPTPSPSTTSCSTA